MMTKEDQQRHERVLYIRLILSVTTFSAFVIINVMAALTHKMGEWSVPMLVLLVASFFIMPREPVPSGYKPQNTPEDKEYLQRMHRIRLWLTYTRMAFFICALVTYLGLPKLV